MPIAAIIAFFGSPLGKIAGYIIAGVVALGTLTGVYFGWRAHITNLAVAKFNLQQAEQTRKDKEEFDRKLNVLIQKQEDLLASVRKKNQAVQNKSDTIDRYIDGTKDRPASDVLKETIRKLENRK